jgi:hypothetical protein
MLVYGGQLELRFGSSRPFAVVRERPQGGRLISRRCHAHTVLASIMLFGPFKFAEVRRKRHRNRR